MKKLLAAVLSVMLVVGLMPASAFADPLGSDSPTNAEKLGEAPVLENSSSSIREDYSPMVSSPLTRSADDIRAFYASHPYDTTSKATYSTTPSPVSPYVVGSLDTKTETNALNALNFVRFVAGIDADVTISPTYSDQVQTAMVVLAANKFLTHYPAQPSGMEDSMYNKGLEGAQKSNIGLRFPAGNLASNIINGWMYDGTEGEGGGNLASVGHRRWCLSTGMQETGFGVATATGSMYEGAGDYQGMYAFDKAGTVKHTNVAWPAAVMPVELFDADFPWSVSVNRADLITGGTNVAVELKRVSDQTKWIFNSSTDNSLVGDDRFYCNTKNYGGEAAIIFRPGNLSSISIGDQFEVKITGLPSGTLSYTVDFFGLEPKDMSSNDIDASVATPTYSYTGSAVEPKPIVKDGVKTLVENVDYTLSYSGNTQVGTATITITGKGDYAGATTASFEITAVSLASATVSPIPSQVYNATALSPELSVVLGSTTLVKDIDYTLTYTNNMSVGTAKVSISGIGNYTGSVETSFSITKRTLSDDLFSIPQSSYVYTGKPITPAVTGMLNGIELSPTNDFSVSYANNQNVGTATINLTGTGLTYQGAATKTFTITAADISSAQISEIASQEYTGVALEPDPNVVINGTTLVRDTDYTLTYSNNVSVGSTASVTITGIGNYTGSATKNFTIDAANIDNIDIKVTGMTYSYPYTGSAITPKPTVSDRAIPLVEGVDYTFSYENNTNAGTATLKINGMGDYAGTKTVNFTIEQVSLSAATVGAIPSREYTAKPYLPEPTVTLGSTTLVKDVDYTLSHKNFISATNTARVFVEGIGNYTGYIEELYSITKRTITAGQFTIPKANYAYTGKAITPEVTGKLNDVTMSTQWDYSYTYSNNKNVGTATINILGKGVNYQGATTKSFTISPADISSTQITDTWLYEHTGSTIEPEPKIVFNGITLVKDTDYTLTYSNNIAMGTSAKVTITGKGNFTGAVTKSFTISQKVLTGAIVSNLPSQYAYSGTAITPLVTVMKNGITLVKDSDYKLTYTNNVKVGTASVTITGTGQYAGTITKTFKIVPANINKAAVSGINASYVYQGKAFTPAPKLTFNKAALKKDVDYTLTYINNKAAGTATILITGKGNFTGSITKTFKIVPANITQAAISGINASYTYQGKALTPAPKLVFNKTTLKLGTDYTLTYSNNKAVGTATINIKGKGNFTGTTTKTFRIVKAASKPAPKPGPVKFSRLAGADRLKTMSAILREGFSKGSCSTVIVATAENYPDALAASSLAGLYDAPIVLTSKASLSPEAKSEVTRLGAKNALIIGSSAAVSSTVEKSLQGMGVNTERVQGADRVKTAVKIYEKGKKTGSGWGKTAIIASSLGFADALSISSFAYTKSYPIFLADGNKELSPEVTAALKAGGFTNAIIVGSPAAVSSNVEGQLKKVGFSSKSIKRLGGVDRYATSIKIAEYAIAHGMKADKAAVATGLNFPDALAGAALCGKNQSIILLVADDATIKSQAKSFFTLHKSKMTKGYALGSSVVVSDSLLKYIEKACN